MDEAIWNCNTLFSFLSLVFFLTVARPRRKKMIFIIDGYFPSKCIIHKEHEFVLEPDLGQQG